MAVLNSFLSYLLVFVILAAIAFAGAMLGIKLAKNKNAKTTASQNEEEQTKE